MPTVQGDIDLPDGSNPSDTTVTIRLVGALTHEAAGYYIAGDKVITGRATPTVAADGTWSATLVANSLITPASTVYEVTYRLPDQDPIADTISVPDGAGPYRVEDILASAPSDLTTAHAHSSHTGLDDDDHTQYSLVDGTRAFTGGVEVEGTDGLVSKLDGDALYRAGIASILGAGVVGFADGTALLSLLLSDTADVLEVRDSTGAALGRLQVDTPTADDDAATKAYVDGFVPHLGTPTAETGTSRTLALTDEDTLIRCTNAAAVTVTVPPTQA